MNLKICIASSVVFSLFAFGPLVAADVPPIGQALVDLTDAANAGAAFSETFPTGSDWNSDYTHAFDNVALNDRAGRVLKRVPGDNPANLSIDIGYRFNTATVVNAYRISMLNDTGVNVPERAPKAWTFQARNENGTWTTLDTRTDEVDWTVGMTRYFECGNATAYTHYRLLFTEVVDPKSTQYGLFLQLAELELFTVNRASVIEPEATPDTSVYAKYIDFTASGVPDGVRLENFPVLVRLSTKMSGFDYEDFLRTDAKDMVFVDNEGNYLPHDIDTWNPSGESLVWVRVPVLTKGATFRLYYGNPAADAENLPARVWSAYVAAWHFNGVETGDAANDLSYDLDKTAVVLDEALVGKGVSNGVARCAKPFSALADGTKFAVSGWVRPAENNATMRLISSKAGYTQKGYELIFVSDGGLYLRGDGGDNTVIYKPNPWRDAMPTGSWIHYAGAVNGSAGQIYMNGEKLESTNNGTVSTVTGHEGEWLAFGGDAAGGNLFTGDLDELRVFNGVPSDAWVQAEHDTVVRADYLTASAVQVTDVTMPLLASATVTRQENGTFLVTATVMSGTGDVTATFVSGTSQISVPLTTTDVTYPQIYSAVVTTLLSDRTYATRVIGTSASGNVNTRLGPTVYTGAVSVVAGENGDEDGVKKGSFVISRADANGDLRVTYALGGTTTNGTSYRELSGDVTIPDGETSVTLWVTPIVDPSLDEDGTLVLTLTGANYGHADGADTATITIANLHVDASVVYVSRTGADDNDGYSLATALATINRAVAILGAEGGTVYVAAGEYVFAPQTLYAALVTLETPVRVVGMTGNPADVVIRRPSGDAGRARGFILRHDGALLRCLTIDGMYLQNSNSTQAGAIRLEAGAVEDCVISHTEGGHWDSRGLGAFMTGGRLTRCVFRNNAMLENYNYGAAIYAKGGLIEDCAIIDNTSRSAATVYLEGSAVMVNCTIAGNTGITGSENNRDCPGVQVKVDNNNHPQVVNCAIFENRTSTAAAEAGRDVWMGDGSAFVNCAAAKEITGGTACIVGLPGFRDSSSGDYALTPLSCCVDNGGNRQATPATSETDVAGNPRVLGATVDVGAYEFVPGALTADFVVSATYSLAPAEITFTAAAFGGEGNITYGWDFNGDGEIDRETSEAVTTWTYADIGTYLPKLIVTNGADSFTVSKDLTIRVAPQVVYVDAANAANAQFPYATRETATADLQAALDMSGDGSRVLVADGTYTREIGNDETRNGFIFRTGLRLESLSGDPSKCILKSTKRATWGSFFHRCLDLNHPNAFVSGFTFENGSLEQYESGACVNIGGLGGVVSNCVIRGGRTSNWGADGAAAAVGANGLLTHCLIEKCVTATDVRQTNHSVLLVNGRVENCLIRDCGDANTHNIVNLGGTGRLLNSTIVDSVCRTNQFAEGSWRSNQSGVRAASGARVTNCVIWGVTRGEEVAGEGRVLAPWTGPAACFVNCATDGTVPNETCFVVTKADAFVNYDEADYHPLKGGALVNRGAADTVLSSSVDLDGGKRITGRSIDVGCYESIPLGLSLRIR